MLNKKRIPTQEEVIARVLFETIINRCKKNVAYSIVATEVISIWRERRKTTILRLRQSVIRSIRLLHEEYIDVRKYCSRETDVGFRKRQEFENKIKSDFDIKSNPRPKKQKAIHPAEKTYGEEDKSIETSSDYEDSDSEFSLGEQTDQIKRFKITPQLVECLDNALISNAKATSIILSVAHALGFHPSAVKVSTSTMLRRRAQLREQISNEIRRNFCSNFDDSFFVLHIDGKILSKWHSADGKSDKLAVVLSNGKKTKILGIADMEKGDAESHFRAIEQQLKDWMVEHLIKAVCFDLTSVNTGGKTGTGQRLRTKYSDNIFILACRRHLLEILISNVFAVSMKDKSTSPDIELFVRFKKIWNDIDHSKTEHSIGTDVVKGSITEEERQQIVSFIVEQLKLQSEKRKDYTQFLNLSLIFLGVRSIDGKRVPIAKPGAIHRARFMGRVINGLKICAYRSQFHFKGDNRE